MEVSSWVTHTHILILSPDQVNILIASFRDASSRLKPQTYSRSVTALYNSVIFSFRSWSRASTRTRWPCCWISLLRKHCWGDTSTPTSTLSWELRLSWRNRNTWSLRATRRSPLQLKSGYWIYLQFTLSLTKHFIRIIAPLLIARVRCGRWAEICRRVDLQEQTQNVILWLFGNVSYRSRSVFTFLMVIGQLAHLPKVAFRSFF